MFANAPMTKNTLHVLFVVFAKFMAINLMVFTIYSK